MQAEIEAIDGNEMPLDHLLRVMRSPGENASVRFAAALPGFPPGPFSHRTVTGSFRSKLISGSNWRGPSQPSCAKGLML
jgi:hypothetical protein